MLLFVNCYFYAIIPVEIRKSSCSCLSPVYRELSYCQMEFDRNILLAMSPFFCCYHSKPFNKRYKRQLCNCVLASAIFALGLIDRAELSSTVCAVHFNLYHNYSGITIIVHSLEALMLMLMLSCFLVTENSCAIATAVSLGLHLPPSEVCAFLQYLMDMLRTKKIRAWQSLRLLPVLLRTVFSRPVESISARSPYLL